MLAATNMLKPPPAVIGSLNKDITLPRTLRLTTLIAVVVGAAFGFLISFLVFGPGLNALMYGPVLGGAAYWASVSLSPLNGESLATWMGLQINGTRNRRLYVDGLAGPAVHRHLTAAPHRRGQGAHAARGRPCGRGPLGLARLPAAGDPRGEPAAGSPPQGTRADGVHPAFQRPRAGPQGSPSRVSTAGTCASA
ncbi:hypothetical protein ACFQY7_49745 [Actinomadura luteofluorescens]|uniref:hypothetical protein n=1 Tax=Actinomadura luteofluorescens TaxID=46163 RepID=UPI00363042CD